MDGLRTAIDIQQAISLNKKELRDNHLDKNVYFVDSMYSLLKQQQKSGSLTGNDKAKLDSFLRDEPFMRSELTAGVDKVKQALDTFISTELPTMRSLDAKTICSHLQSLLRTVDMHIQSEIGNVDRYKQTREDKKQERITKDWRIFLAGGRKSANHWLYYNFLNKRNDLIKQWEVTFSESVESIFHDEAALGQSLEELVSTTDIQGFLHNLDPLEWEERSRLVKYHLESIKVAIDAVTRELWELLESYARILQSEVLSSAGISVQWMLEDVMTYEKCFSEIQNQVMAIIYPLIYATLEWPTAHDKRVPAVLELHNAVPHLFYRDATTDSGEQILRLPGGPKGVLEMAIENGFLAKQVAELAIGALI